jgi:DNA recombination protein RmuC
MTLFEIILVVILILLIGFILYQSFFVKNNSKEQDPNPYLIEWLKEIQSSVDKTNQVVFNSIKNQNDTINSQMQTHRTEISKQTKVIWEQLDSASKAINDVSKHLGGLQEFSKDMKDLSNVLKSPKLRGSMGEQFLYEILANILPKNLYKKQYKFKNGVVCDAVVITERGIIPIDSKFSFENFKLMREANSEEDRLKAKKAFIKDVKNRITEISSKYILPKENTTEQALMYVPSELVYYELIVNTPEIETFAKAHNTVLVSPNTLSYFLKVILVGYQQQQLQSKAVDILKALSGIKNEAKKFDKDLDVLTGHIDRSYKSVENVKSRYTKLYKSLETIQQLGTDKKESLLDEA